MDRIKQFTDKEVNEMNHFDQVSAQYEANYSYENKFTQYKIEKKTEEFASIISQHCNIRDMEIVELGCGTGEYTKRIAHRFNKSKVISIDISKNILDIAKVKCKEFENVTFKVSSAYDTGLIENSVDVVCGFYALHHFDFDPINIEACRILKKGGLLFFYEPNILNPMVYIIKSSQVLKKKFGDSPDEWAINPVTISKHFPEFEVIQIYTTEFIWPLKFIPNNFLILLDKISSLFKFLPGFRLLGGSIVICLKKR